MKASISVIAVLGALVLAASAFSAPPPPPPNGAMYVSAAGTDTNDCSATAPCFNISRTIGRAKAAHVVQVYVEVGQYPGILRDVRAFPPPSAPVRVSSYGQGRATVSGITLRGEADTNFDGLRVVMNPAANPQQVISTGQDVFHHYPTARVRFTDLHVDCNGGGQGVVIRNSDDVTLEDSRVEHCFSGIGGPGNTGPSNRIRVLRNYVGLVPGDNMQFGEWHDVVVDGNYFDGAIRPPTSTFHNDNFQMTGDGEHIRVTNNVMRRSAGQNMIIQNVVGPLDDVVFANNVMWDAKAYAIQITGVSRMQFVNNTVWDHGFGSLLLRGTMGADSFVTNNVLRTMLHDGVASYEYLRAGNWIGRFDGKPADGDPGFVDEASGDLHLLPGSPARLRAVDDFAYGPLDRENQPRAPQVAGALR